MRYMYMANTWSKSNKYHIFIQIQCVYCIYVHDKSRKHDLRGNMPTAGDSDLGQWHVWAAEMHLNKVSSCEILSIFNYTKLIYSYSATVCVWLDYTLYRYWNLTNEIVFQTVLSDLKLKIYTAHGKKWVRTRDEELYNTAAINLKTEFLLNCSFRSLYYRR